MSKQVYVAGDHQDNQASPLPDWRELLAILLERIWVGIGVALLVFLFFLLRVQREIPQYRSTALLLVEAQIPRLMQYQDVLGYNMRSLEYFNTIISTLHSKKMMERALGDSGLAARPDFLAELNGLEAKAMAALRWVRVEAMESSRLIHVTVEHPDRQLASDLANAMAKAYIQQDLNDRMQTSMQAVEWFRERSVEYREKLEKGLAELQQYREATESVSLDEGQDIVVAKLKALNMRLTEATAERIDAEAAWSTIQAQINAGVSLVRIAAQLRDQGVDDALVQLRAQQQVVTNLRQRYKSDYPDLVEAIDQELRLEKVFRDACSTAFYALKANNEVARAREAGLLAALREQEQLSFALDRKLVRYNDLRRNVQADEDVYQAVIARMKETSLSGSQPSEIIRLAEEARPAHAPFRPQKLQVLVRAAGLGLVLGVGAILLLYYGDHRFRRAEEVERALGVPVLATLPIVAGDDVHQRGLITHLHADGEIAEAFRTLRASLHNTRNSEPPAFRRRVATQLASPAAKDAQVLLFTSSRSSEGKSLISANLAICFSQAKGKTLLLGTDLRRPALARIFGQEREGKGLVNVLQGHMTWRDAVQPDCLPNLDLLSSGEVPRHPHDVLGSENLGTILSEMRSQYDCIIVDAPPVLGLSDCLVLLPHVDAFCFVVRYAVTHSWSAVKAMETIRKCGVPCLGAIINGVNLGGLASYYYKRYYSGYAYRAYHAEPAVAVKHSA